MHDRETISFYLRVVFLPLVLLSTVLRAWGSGWSSLETVHDYQEAHYQHMWDILPAEVQEAVRAGNEDTIEDQAVRRFARMLGDYSQIVRNLEGARTLNSKYHYRNTLDAAQRRLRIARYREAAAVEALGNSSS